MSDEAKNLRRLIDATGFDTFEQALEFVLWHRDIANMADKACVPKEKNPAVDQAYDRMMARIAGEHIEEKLAEYESELARLRTALAAANRAKVAHYDCHAGPGTTQEACGACLTCLHRALAAATEARRVAEEDTKRLDLLEAFYADAHGCISGPDNGEGGYGFGRYDPDSDVVKYQVAGKGPTLRAAIDAARDTKEAK